ncbi:RagB/SusD family nutrient uptake outer membrane protein [Prevotella sp. 10(H)]|uniref:RagB/SusD family nutrient uptake outer membrane protein n=1 Tax=Prevotella sp. 10(H) TaxID=1158294 RepID=UPI0004A73C1B|nr:RagB/SusD family nutrient uptake outer membrane protein [Prevotella sp. 10(H)]
MNTKIFRYIILSLGLIYFSSCSDFLDKDPDDELTLEMVFGDKTRTEEWLANVYNQVEDPYSLYDRVEAMGDDYVVNPGWEQFGISIISYQTGNWNPSSSWNPNYWNILPQKIRAAHIFIQNAKPNAAQLFTLKEVNYMKAEAKFLIAYYHYLLLRYYGAIPILDKITDIYGPAEEIMVGQVTFDQAVEWINQQLIDAAKELPPMYEETTKYGRATSIMCHAIRARLLLFAASPLVNGNQDPMYANFTNSKGEKVFDSEFKLSKWEKAVTAYEDLLKMALDNGHKLYYEYLSDGSIDPFMSYQNVFFKKFNDGNKEILFARAESIHSLYEYVTQPRGTGGTGAVGVSQLLVDDFFMSNGLRPILGYNANGSPIINSASGYIEKGFSTSNEYRDTKWAESKGDPNADNNPVTLAGTYNMYCNREARFYVSVLYNGCWYRREGRETQFYKDSPDGGPTHDSPCNGYLARKKVHPDCDPRNKVSPYRPAILVRLAEVYLSLAEALNEVSYSEKAIEYVNLIRERAGLPQYGNGEGEIPAPKDQDELREAIRIERRIELCCESALRFDDIRRWKTADKILNNNFWGMNANGKEKSDDDNNPDAFFVRKIYQKRMFKSYWMPVPQSDTDKNSNLRQLPGW